MPARARSNRTPDGAKRRWTPEERAARGAASERTHRGGGPRAAKREERFGTARPAQEEGGAKRQSRGVDWYPGPRNADRTDRRAGDGRFGGQRGDRQERPARGDRDARAGRDAGATSRVDRSERQRPREERFDRRARPPRGDRTERPQRFDRDARPQRADRSERPQRFERADRTERPERAERPQRFERDARPQRADRPRTDRPRQDRDRRPERAESRFFGDQQKPARFEAPEDVVLERLEGEVVTAADVAGRSFADLGLGEQITKALAELGATEPFPIQAATIPAALAGRNVLGRGRTGSGKTIAFGAALVERLLRNWAESGRTGSGRRMGRPPRALILAPTRELALQIDRTVQPIARAVGLYTTQIVGGVPQGRQVGALAKGVDIVIGTPGRIEDLLEQGRLDLGAVEIAVLDEADHMADLGFLEPIQRLLRQVPAAGQRLLFSATLDAAVAQLVEEFLPDPDVHEVADAEGSTTADHRVLVIEQGEKIRVLAALAASVDRSLVFARTRAFAEQLADDLDAEGVRTESLHGDLNQARRTRNLARFTEGKVQALVATDVAARGIHVDDIELVVHADSAEDYKTYLHRSGRTGRAGASGSVVTLITARRRRRFTELLERAGVDAEFVVLRAGEDPVAALSGTRRG
ncbi:DEAD/DEAH box helicase [Amnibacterium kyonggiense]|uniref:Superfamily II DNA/RNA helicase n=1 Tax=Amnibacterium kyonggiense TaxID=595671 RepID=A0A4R7FQS1_9MICO|nr:DEAD/DEAH box helicase [Amnibacterium kyonggiense]TDS79959.1 superfamily II DNA/RNA helicase [Amnibacterium kyonggiense]